MCVVGEQETGQGGEEHCGEREHNVGEGASQRLEEKARQMGERGKRGVRKKGLGQWGAGTQGSRGRDASIEGRDRGEAARRRAAGETSESERRAPYVKGNVARIQERRGKWNGRDAGTTIGGKGEDAPCRLEAGKAKGTTGATRKGEDATGEEEGRRFAFREERDLVKKGVAREEGEREGTRDGEDATKTDDVE